MHDIEEKIFIRDFHPNALSAVKQDCWQRNFLLENRP